MKSLIAIVVALVLSGCSGSGSKTPAPYIDSSSSSSSVDNSVNNDCSAPAVSSGGDWQLVWSDEFDGEQINTEKWSFETNCAGGGNNELQCYVDSPENAFVADGALHIRAINEPVEGYDGWFGTSGNWVTRDYSSARLRTLHKGDWTYGRIEIRARLPFGQGIWPAAWMLPTDNVYGGWPYSGEIDIMEAVNLRTGGEDNNRAHGYLHYTNAAGDQASSGTSFDPGSDLADEFHTYALEWEQGEIRWYIDDYHYQTQRQSVWTQCHEQSHEPQNPAAPFDQSFHLLLNLAIGGEWPGSPDDTTTWPQTYTVDYVRVYECSTDPDTGHGCATISPGAQVIE